MQRAHRDEARSGLLFDLAVNVRPWDRSAGERPHNTTTRVVPRKDGLMSCLLWPCVARCEVQVSRDQYALQAVNEEWSLQRPGIP